MYFVVEFVVDKTLEVIDESSCIFDGNPFEGQFITVMWKAKKKPKEYEAKILFLSDLRHWLDKLQNAVRYLENNIQPPDDPITDEPAFITRPSSSQSSAATSQSSAAQPVFNTLPSSSQSSADTSQSSTTSQEPHNDQRDPNDAIDDEAEFFFKHPVPTPEVEELFPGSRVYIDSKIIQSIKIAPKTHTGIARNIMVAIFTDAALCSCSMGKIGSNGEKARKGLPPRAVKALFGASRKIAEEFNLKIEMDANLVKNLGTKLSEFRKKTKPTA